MGKRVSGKSLAESLQKVADSAKSTVQKIKFPENKKTETNASGQHKGLLKRGGESADQAKSSEPSAIKRIATRNALMIIYYLMAADGTILHGEEEKFDAIGAELDPDFFTMEKESIIKDCQAQMEKIIDADDYYDALQDGVEDAILSSKQTADTFITPKLLVWNLLSVAYSDEKYNETECKLLKYIVRKLDIDKAVFLELESSILTLMDIEKEISWIKTTDRPYLTIEARVNELTKRKSVIFDSVKNLIAL